MSTSRKRPTSKTQTISLLELL